MPKRYATDLKNMSRDATKFLLSEVVCHDLSSLKTHDFNSEVNLINGRPAPTKSRRLILQAMGLEDDGMMEILTASDARFSPLATCRQDDVVLLQDGGGFRAAKIKLHFKVADECLSLVQPFTLHRRATGTPLAVWRVNDGDPHETWATQDILAAVEYCVYPDGNVGTILPIEYR